MADMSVKKQASDKEIDKIVIAQADDESAWEEPIQVHLDRPAAVSIPAELAARAAFLARLHRKSSVEEWVMHVIQERVDLEEAAFAGAKRELALGKDR
jgi:hypothetical protein